MTAPSWFRSGSHAASEPLVVEQLEQGGEALAIAVVRRGGEEQLVLEVRGERPDRLGALAVGGVLARARGGDVVRLVDDQQIEAPRERRLVRPMAAARGAAAAAGRV